MKIENVSGKSDQRGLSELRLKSEYRSDQDDFVGDFYVPCLGQSINYWRAAGYFTSRSLSIVAQGLTSLIKAGGKMRLVVSPLFTLEDLDAIQKGYAARQDIVAKSLLRAIDTIPNKIVEDRLGYLAWMIAEENLEIRVAIPLSEQNVPKIGIYHEKLGLFLDELGNTVAFTGSPNETAGGLVENFETIDVFCSWDDSQGRVTRKRSNFERLWNDHTSGLSVIGFPEAARQQLLKFRPNQVVPESSRVICGKIPVQSNRWKHQKEAVTEFLKSERGILEMATGTGKTKTALQICELLTRERTIDTIIISADGNDLLYQWYIQLLDLVKNIPQRFAIARNYNVYRELERFLVNQKQTILLISRPNLAGALRSLSKADAERTLLIHDEVHRLGSLGNRQSLSGLSDNIRFRLGLSATPDREYDQDGNNFIGEHIGSVLFRFGLEDAIRRGILAPFNYYPIEYVPDADDRLRLQQIFKKEAARREAGNPMSPEEIWMDISRVYKTSRAKLPLFESFIRNHLHLLERCIVFVETKDYGDEVLQIIHKYRHDFHTYFAEDDSTTLQRFATGDIECLLTCHRLSEGIDIRSLKTVILFSSSRARLETIQRMGRCLRVDPNDPQKRANVVDFVRAANNQFPGAADNSDQERRDWLAQLAEIQPEEITA